MTNAATRKDSLKIGATVCLGSLLLYILWQLLSIYQTRRQLTSPLIPVSLIKTISKEPIGKLRIASLMLAAGLVLFFFKKHILVIIVATVSIILLSTLAG